MQGSNNRNKTVQCWLSNLRPSVPEDGTRMAFKGWTSLIEVLVQALTYKLPFLMKVCCLTNQVRCLLPGCLFKHLKE